MSLVFAAALVASGQAVVTVPAVAPENDVAYAELTAGMNELAIDRIEANDALDASDPARLINLGIAHAREGEDEQAREYFDAAMRSDARLQLETATGEWTDSRVLAKTALRKLNRGDFAPQMASSR